MKALLAVLAALALAAGLAATAMGANETLSHSGRMLIAIGGDVTLPAGEQADGILVVNGTATIDGTANTVVVVDGTAVTHRATLENLFVVRGTAVLGTGTRVLNDVRTWDGSVTRADGVTVGGTTRGLESDLVGLAWLIGAAAVILWIGFGLATILVALLVAGLAARQLRFAEGLISREPGKTFVIGLLGAIGLPLVAVLAIVSIVGIPVGIGLLVVALPGAAFVGWIVAAIWIGEFILRRTREEASIRRPYLAAVVGVIVAAILGVVPLLTAIISVFGFGAVLLGAWRTLRAGGSEPMAPPVVAQPA